MIRALVFITSLGFMISIGVLTCNHISTADDDPAHHPPSIRRLHGSTYSYLSPPEEEIDTVFSIE